MKKKIIIFLIIFSILFSSASFCLAIETEKGLEITYPPTPAGTEGPRTTKTYLPYYIFYIVEFFIVFAALAALAALIFGGFRYLTSAGSPGAMTEAKDQIFAGILGLVLLISSFLILRTINPQLTSFKITAEPKFEGIVLYRGIADCGGAEGRLMEDKTGRKWEWKEVLHYLEGQGKAARYNVSTSDLREISGDDRNKVLSIRFPLEFYDQKMNDLKARVIIYSELSWQGEPSLDSDELDLGDLFGGEKQGCLSFIKKAGSLLFTWKTPGVYLCSAQLKKEGEKLICPTSEAEEKIEEKIYTMPRPQYPDLVGFGAVGIKFENTKERSYGAILHSDTIFRDDMTVCLGDAEVLNYSNSKLPTTIRNKANNYGPDEANCLGWVERKWGVIGPASLTVFQWDKEWATSSTSTVPTNGIYDREKLYQDSLVLYEKEEFGGRARVFQLKYEASHGADAYKKEKFEFFGKKLPIMVFKNFDVIKFNLDEDGYIITNPDTEITQNIRSLKIFGNYLVILCRYRDLGGVGNFPYDICQAFFNDNSDLPSELIGRCREWIFWRLTPCAASMVVIPLLSEE